jgi:hypothetical protein
MIALRESRNWILGTVDAASRREGSRTESKN